MTDHLICRPGFGFAVGMSMARSLLGGRREEPAPASSAHAHAEANACGIHNQDFSNVRVCVHFLQELDQFLP